VDSTTEIGPTIGKDLQKDALLAIIFSIIAIIIYIAVRFEFKFGVAAAVATVHDVCAVLAIFFILNKEINLLIVTALLTLAVIRSRTRSWSLTGSARISSAPNGSRLGRS